MWVVHSKDKIVLIIKVHVLTHQGKILRRITAVSTNIWHSKLTLIHMKSLSSIVSPKAQEINDFLLIYSLIAGPKIKYSHHTFYLSKTSSQS